MTWACPVLGQVGPTGPDLHVALPLSLLLPGGGFPAPLGTSVAAPVAVCLPSSRNVSPRPLVPPLPQLFHGALLSHGGGEGKKQMHVPSSPSQLEVGGFLPIKVLLQIHRFCFLSLGLKLPQRLHFSFSFSQTYI